MECNASTVTLVRSLRDKLTADPVPPLEKILRILQKLYKLPITIDVLHETGIGKVVNGFRKYEGEIAEKARSLVQSWKAMVREAMEKQASKPNPSETSSQSEVISSQSPEKKASPRSVEAVSKSRSPAKQQVSRQILDSPRKSSPVKSDVASKSQSPSKSQKAPLAGTSSDVASKLQSSSKSHSTTRLKRSRDEVTSDADFTRLKEKPSSTGASPVKKLKTHPAKDRTTQEITAKNEVAGVALKSSSSEKKVTSTSRDKSHDRSHDRKPGGVTKTTEPKANSRPGDVKLEPNEKHHSSPVKKSVDAGHKISQNKTNKVLDSDTKSKTPTKPVKPKKPSEENSGSKTVNAKAVSKSENASPASKKDVKKSKTSQKDQSGSKNQSLSPSIIGQNDTDDDSVGQSFNTSGMSFADCLVSPVLTKVKKVVKSKTSHLKSPSKTEAQRPSTSKPSTSKKTSESTVSKSKGKTSDSSKKIKVENSYADMSSSSEEARRFESMTFESPSRGQSSDSGQGSDAGRRNRKKRSMSEEEEEAFKQAKKARKESTDVSLNLPEIQPNYKPMRLPDVTSPLKKRTLTAEEEQAFLGSKQGRTKVFSGRSRLNCLTSVRRLYDICMEVLCDNIDALDEVGGVPYEILSPVLQRCTPQQLFHLEDCNPHFLEDSDPLWQKHTKRDFKGKRPPEMETWRELYIREHDARDAKLKSITANITAQMAAKDPGRLTKMAFMDRPAKPPRNVMRQQLLHGTASGKHLPEQRSKSTVQPHRPTRIIQPSCSDESGSQRRHTKPTKVIAPMMMKTLRMIKKFRR